LAYTLQYGQVWGFIPYLLAGAILTMQLAAIAFLAGALIGLLCASVLSFGPSPLRGVVRAYVTFFLNTPLLVQVFFIFFVLPEAGILLSPFSACAIGMSLNAGAYMTEIERAGFASLRRAELDAAETLGFSLPQTIWFVIVPHIVRALFPPLSNQFIIQIMTTSLAAIFAVEELTGRAYNINAQTFRTLEIFSILAVIYVALTILASALLVFAGRSLFRVRASVF
jgi:polar amino acid transport system permease protein